MEILYDWRKAVQLAGRRRALILPRSAVQLAGRRWALMLLLVCGCGRIGFSQEDAVAQISDGGVAESAESAADAHSVVAELAASGPFTSVVSLVELNSAQFDDDPTVTDDLLEICFERSAGPTAVGNIWCSTREFATEVWGEPAPVGELNTSNDEGAPRLSADGLTMWFSSDRPGTGSVDIYITTRTARDQPWQPPTQESTINTDAAETLFVCNRSATRAVFSRLRPGLALNSLDLYVTDRESPNEPWGEARPVVELNTEQYGEAMGSLSADELTLYAYSNPGGGPVNLYRANRTRLEEPFGPLEPLFELNSEAREEDPWIAADGHALFFTRDGDLFMATR